MADTLTPAPQVPQQPKKKSWFARHKIMSGLLGIVALIVIISVANSGGSSTSGTENTSANSGTSASTDDNTQAQAQAPAHKAKPAHKTKPAAPAMTVSQENALESAKNYLSMTGFSRMGLIQQLSSKAGDGYPKADAAYAVNHLKVNWNKQAVRSGKNYLDMTGFSRKGLIQQLSSKAGDGYTHAQAVYAANHLGL